jgi:hypothetical protein
MRQETSRLPPPYIQAGGNLAMRASRTRRHLLRLIVLGVAVVGASACDVVVTSLESNGKAQDQWTHSYPLASGELEIVNPNGSIDVVGADVSQVEVVAERIAKAATDEDAKRLLGDLQIGEQVSATRVRLETRPPAGEGRRIEVRYHVKVPVSVNVRLTCQNGSVDAAALKGEFRAEAGNGTIKGRDLTGLVDANSTNGSIRLELAAVASGGVRAETVNGRVELSIPATSKADVQASVVNGNISVEGLELEGPKATRRRVEGRLNGGGPKVVLEATNGRIQLIGK